MLSGIHSIIGKSLSVYENADDLGEGEDEDSLIDGNSGLILGCCIVQPVPSLLSLTDFFN